MEKTEKQPEGPGQVGLKEDPTQTAEVGGRGEYLLYTCFNDGAGNYVAPGQKWWTCWRCGTTTYADGTVTIPKYAGP